MKSSKGFFGNLIGKLTGEASSPALPEPAGDDAAAVTPPLPAQRGLEQDKPRAGFFERLKQGLSKTSESLVGRIDALLLGKKEIDADTLEELEEILITADIGVTTTVELIRSLERRLGRDELKDAAALRNALKQEILVRMEPFAAPLDVGQHAPFVMLVIGVNGVGKTTTIGKLASRFSQDGRKVLIAAADTFRAAAADQLAVWAERTGVDLVRHQDGGDPSAVVYDACKASLARKTDVLIIDTAGRLHTKVNLMEELKKILRIVGREIPGSPHEILLVLDAATGQNAISQAKLFRDAAPVSGIALTKLDGSAKGGVVLAVCNELKIPLRYIGVGESVEDLRDFVPQEFVDALFQ
jgi:fused signal recognition particle receptor